MAEGKVVYEITGDNSGFQKSVNETESVASGGFDKIKLKAVAVWAAVGAAVIKAGKVIGQVIGDAVNQYAEYEQLVGGVETLFKDSSDVVQEYAANAYKTAGLSANEYMSTVTSFSASLLQSLGGDTEKAAELSNLAITDMADNANKMGTSMEAIQVAYQGFAKQNYTMLDNLKLGYGGTKSEMERLIADANKLKEAQGEAGDLTIEKYSDVIEAIHLVQTELGITGTTAKEAATTIQGSANMVKAAWKNLLTGLGDENADIDALVGNFMDSVGTLIDNLLPVIGRVLEALWQMLVEAGSRLAEIAGEWMSQMGAAIQEKASEVWDTILEFFAEKFEAIREFFAEIWEGIVEFFAGIWDSIKQIFVDVWNSLSEENQAWLMGIWETIQERWNAICEFFKAIWEAISSAVTTAVEAISTFLSNAWNIIKGVIEAVWNAISGFFKSIWEAIKSTFTDGVNNAKSIFEGFKNTISQIWENIKGIFNGFITFFRGVFTGDWKAAWEGICDVVRNMVGIFRTLGSNLMEGLKNGILEKARHIIEAVKGAVQDAVQAAKNLLGISSPSRVFKQMGRYVDEGLAEGVKDRATDPISAVVSMVSRLINGAMGGLSAAYNTSYATTSNTFSVGKISDVVHVRSEQDIDTLLEAIYQRFMTEKRGRGLF